MVTECSKLSAAKIFQIKKIRLCINIYRSVRCECKLIERKSNAEKKKLRDLEITM